MRRIGSYKDSGAVMEWKIESSSLKRNFNSIVSMEIRSNVDLSTKYQYEALAKGKSLVLVLEEL